MSKKDTSQLLLGAHMSIAGGVEKAIYAGHSIGCTAIQIFTHSNRQWAVKPFDEDSIERFKQAQKETGLTHVVSHASYLINLASASAETRKKSKICLAMELFHCHQLGIQYLVLHPGSGEGNHECFECVSDTIHELFEEHPEYKVTILLEIMAGQGNSLGSTFEHLALLMKKIHKPSRVGICIDTCHLWAGGYDFSTEKKYEALMQHIDETVGLSRIHAFHCNDSLKSLGSNLDRHQHIGKGTIPLEAFALLMNDPRFFDVPKILELQRRA